MDMSAIISEILNGIFASIIEVKALRILVAILFVFGLLLLIYKSLPFSSEC